MKALRIPYIIQKLVSLINPQYCHKLSVLSVVNSFIFSFILFCQVLHADPWGKDADLANRSCCTISVPSSCRTPLFGAFGETMIRFHQDVISPCDGPRSHFKPSSSQYTLDAMRKYGFFQGVSMGCDRLMRENKDEWVYRWTRDGAGKLIKYDPVP